MEKKTAKRLWKGALFLFFLVLSLVASGDLVFPDRISRFAGEEVESRLCFSLEAAAEPAEENEERGRILAFGILPVKSVAVESFEKVSLIPGGELFGIRMEIEGLIVSGVGNVEGTDRSPAEEAGIAPGDRILNVNGISLRGAASFTRMLAKSGGKAVRLDVEKNGEERSVILTPAKDPNGVWRAGLWVREAAAGIGTVTFTDPASGTFAGLGHGVCDRESGELLPLCRGTICRANPESVKRATAAEPGEIRGELTEEAVGAIRANTPTGIYGAAYDADSAGKEAIPIALKGEIKPGKITILCQLDETGKQPYEAVIETICDRDGETKNFVIRITDEKLLEKTGGIIQGMSGSPILKDGKLIGAVTHVMLRDPKRGYGIFIENMLRSAAETQAQAEAA
ncbi:MAG: SpoIVB peptidase [Clostridia bacterium]|nr:SpoIVB peptidase [Clostridia bacterium]